jgi:hypothetical protein
MLQEYFGDSVLGHQGYFPGIYFAHSEGERCLGFRNPQMTGFHLKDIGNGIEMCDEVLRSGCKVDIGRDGVGKV